jgi:hypothetical protein
MSSQMQKIVDTRQRGGGGRAHHDVVGLHTTARLDDVHHTGGIAQVVDQRCFARYFR